MKAWGLSNIRHLGVVLIPLLPGRNTHTHSHTHTHTHGYVRIHIQGLRQIRIHERVWRSKYRHAVKKHTRSQRLGKHRAKQQWEPTLWTHTQTHTHTQKPFLWLVIGPYLGDWYFSLPLPMSSKLVHMAQIKGVAGCMLLLYCQPLLLIRKQDHRQY